MLSKKLIRRIASEHYQKYQKEGVNITLNQLIKKTKSNAQKAENNYLKLKPPKTSSKEIYLTYWIREALDKDFARRTLITIDYKNPPPEPYFQALVEYFSLLPLELIRKLNQEINNTPPADRKKLWEDFNFPVKEVENKFIKLILARRDYFLKKEQLPPLKASLKQFKIPKKGYQRFLQDRDEIIKLCNKLLPDTGKMPSWFYSEFNLPCFVCRLAKFPLKDFKQTIDFVFQKYSCFSVFKPKVKIKMGEATFVKYEKITDSFLITIDKYANFRHQLMGLIHELSHIINLLKDFQNRLDILQKGKYFQEKGAIEIEFSLLKALSENLLRASLSKVLLTFWRVIFEMDLYENPNQNIEKLYAHTFNLCFRKANQKRNRFYILNEQILTAPFSTLPHAVAYFEIVQKNFFSTQ